MQSPEKAEVSVSRKLKWNRRRKLAMCNLAIDSKLRGCDLFCLRTEGIAPQGLAIDRAVVRLRKTGRPLKFELTERTREAVDAHIKAAGLKPRNSSSPVEGLITSLGFIPLGQ